MKKYEVNVSGPAIQDLDDIYFYIAFILLEKDTAEKQISRIEKQILRLEYLPERHQICDFDPWDQMGVRQIPVDNYIVYYIIDEVKQSVTITRVLYGGSNVQLLKLR